MSASVTRLQTRAAIRSRVDSPDQERVQQDRRWQHMRDLVMDREPHRERPSAADYDIFVPLVIAAVAITFGAWLGAAIVTLVGVAAGIA